MIKIDGKWFKDELGRTLILRGVNLSGSSKVPYTPDGATHLKENFFDHRNVSFVGRPFPLEEAEEHFSRLKSWGLTFLRFLVTWEAIEHAGPGIYDEEYLDYIYQVVKKAGEHGINLFIDPHEDVWSRFSGGDGAPGWTFDLIGMDITHFHETGAAFVHAMHGDPVPAMIWTTNNNKLAAATMFTLFFGGNYFAPQVKVDEENIQDYLQRHYIQAIQQVVKRLKGLPNVVGYNSMNEPSSGFIGVLDLNYDFGALKKGMMPTPYQGMLLGAGFPQDVYKWDVGFLGLKRLGVRRMNPQGVKVWKEGYDCIWRQHGVWDIDESGAPQLLQPNYFYRVKGKRVDFANHCLQPHIKDFTKAIRQIDPEAFIFIEGVPTEKIPVLLPKDADRIVNASHWYDNLTLLKKNFTSLFTIDTDTMQMYFGFKNIRKAFVNLLANEAQKGWSSLGDVPTLIGEIGLPFDMQNKKAYRTGNFSMQIKAMDASLHAIEANLLNATIWNYAPDNDNTYGDQWNNEDFSIFSRDQQHNPEDINSGGRALQAVLRPYALKTAGEPLKMEFNPLNGLFEFQFRHDPAVEAPTEIFVPMYQYPKGINLVLSDGRHEINQAEQKLIYYHTKDMDTHTIKIRRIG
jgi:hypothetical protein